MRSGKSITKRYMQSYGALYGDGEIKTKKKKAVCKDGEESELKQQIKLCVWLEKKGILYFAIPNGGSRHMLEAINLKRGGVKAGVPDLCIPVPKKHYHGLYIELKKTKGKLSEHQQCWLDKLSKNGYCAVVAYGYSEAQRIIEEYYG